VRERAEIEHASGAPPAQMRALLEEARQSTYALGLAGAIWRERRGTRGVVNHLIWIPQQVRRVRVDLHVLGGRLAVEERAG
jgi:hypothetical protein